VILSVDGTDINDDSGLRFKLATLKRGASINVIYSRDGRERSKKIRVDTPQESPKRDEREIDTLSPIDGAVTVNMSPALGEELGFDPYVTGVLVSQVKSRSFASGNRLRPGDLILEVNGTEITSTRQLESLLSSEKYADEWRIQIDRNGRIGLLPIRYVPAESR